LAYQARLRALQAARAWAKEGSPGHNLCRKNGAREGGGGGAHLSDPDPTSLPGMAALSWRSLNQLNQTSSSLRKGCPRPQQDLYIAIRFKAYGLRNHQGLASGQRSLRPNCEGSQTAEIERAALFGRGALAPRPACRSAPYSFV